MRDEWDGLDDLFRYVVVFRLRCNNCQGGLVGEFTVSVDQGWRGEDFNGGHGGTVADRLLNAGRWTRYNPDDYEIGLANRDIINGKLHVGRICKCPGWPVPHNRGGWNDDDDEGRAGWEKAGWPVPNGKQLRLALEYLDDVAAYDRALSSVDDADWDGDTAIMQRKPSNWHEVGIQLRRTPPTERVAPPKRPAAPSWPDDAPSWPDEPPF